MRVRSLGSSEGSAWSVSEETEVMGLGAIEVQSPVKR